MVLELDKTAGHVAERRSIALHSALRDLGLHDHGAQKSSGADLRANRFVLWEQVRDDYCGTRRGEGNNALGRSELLS